MKTQEILENVTELKSGIECMLVSLSANLQNIDKIMEVINQIAEIEYKTGHKDGYTEGYIVGVDDGDCKQYDEGYDLGYSNGCTDGYEDGYEKGYEDAYYM